MKSNFKIDIEVLSLQNLNQLTELVLEFWNDCLFEEELESYKSIIDSEDEICYVVKHDEHYIAFVHLSTRNDYVEGAENLPVAYVEGIYVKPAYQKQGIAKELVKIAENWVKEKGFTQIASDTESGNLGSIDFHTKSGFTEVERIVCFIKNL
ncbi:Aminoglycoside N(6')-acetyltransferase type 1 [Flavobacterium bizetiae]|uniref:Aminoglycoside N(6')-acetyltransferase type 1 n=1 Tax=Flavobacterium bizetiae TaxID=2704140 RepID=A0A6J4GLK4_9FLAO|nr:aminoglycoside 6'-N-acetyltransferase [Flavobacterium bizetiae]CAA9200049.1 Aminoglycoside N(6')-acetyltransferase type 1 [Flavobacterium bizetiae]CAD5343474.1 Aminoglycoside N(6')-acetyltransferase type 1 [Flavobacterium bizetiae]CAD5349467.1 Aminoglycoside N(6')-acetyltransferase type 1 [Flavobacterium bizetiae]